MANYVLTKDLTPVALETAVELLETTVSFEVISYRVGCAPKFMLIVPSPNKVA